MYVIVVFPSFFWLLWISECDLFMIPFVSFQLLTLYFGETSRSRPTFLWVLHLHGFSLRGQVITWLCLFAMLHCFHWQPCSCGPIWVPSSTCELLNFLLFKLHFDWCFFLIGTFIICVCCDFWIEYDETGLHQKYQRLSYHNICLWGPLFPWQLHIIKH